LFSKVANGRFAGNKQMLPDWPANAFGLCPPLPTLSEQFGGGFIVVSKDFLQALPNFGFRLLHEIYPAFRVLFPNQVIRADDLARAMVDVALRGTGERRTLVFENRDIRAIVDSIHSLPSSPAED
jgi:hypothetical protein